MKKYLLLCLSVLMVFQMNAYAVSFDNKSLPSGDLSVIKPQMTYILKAGCNLTITADGQAQVESSIVGYIGVTGVEIKAELQQYKNGVWSSINSWTKSSNNYRLNLAESTQVSKGYSYRVVATVTAYSGNDSETRSIVSDEDTY